MKTATGRAFLAIDDRFRIGFITINPNNPVTADKFISAVEVRRDAEGEPGTSWSTTQDTNGSTPNRTALHRVGRYYPGATDGINAGMTPDPLRVLLPAELRPPHDGRLLERLASRPSATRTTPTAATRRAPTAPTTAASPAPRTRSPTWRPTTTRPTCAPPGRVTPQNNVPTSTRDQNPAQHMVTFTLGLGLEGFMDYQSDYETALHGRLRQDQGRAPTTPARGPPGPATGRCRHPTSPARWTTSGTRR